MKADLKKLLPAYTAPRGRFVVVTVPAMQFLMVDGQGDPNTSAAYADALATLFPVAYALKFASKRELDRDYTVMPLEALWWADDMAAFTARRDKNAWRWTVMNLVPEWIGADLVTEAREHAARKGGSPSLEALRLERFDEGLSVQTLHVGPYDGEGPVLVEMHDEILAKDLRMTGKHHEIYLNDARRTAPERLRTILRQPVGHVDRPSGIPPRGIALTGVPW